MNTTENKPTVWLELDWTYTAGLPRDLVAESDLFTLSVGGVGLAREGKRAFVFGLLLTEETKNIGCVCEA